MDGKDYLDDVLKSINGFGLSQKINIAYTFILGFLCAISEFSYAMTTSALKHRCLISECENNTSSYNQPWLSAMIPKSLSNEFQSCFRFNSSGVCGETSGNATSKCDSFVYETEEWTIERENWGINCDDDRWMLNLIGSLYNTGQFIGGLYVGYLGDRFGRKRVIVTSAVLVSILGSLKSFAFNYPMMATIEMIEASFAVILYNGSFVLALEIVEPSKRVLAGFFFSCSYPLGEVVLASVQWLTLDWRTSLRVLYPPFFLTILLLWTMPESVRWLLNKRRSSAALAVLRQIAKINGTNLPEEAEDQILTQDLSQKKSDGEEIKIALKKLIKSVKMRTRFIICIFLWVANTFIYFGMTLNSQSIDKNKFLNFILTALVDIPATTLMTLLLDKIGRKRSQVGSILLCGTACLLFVFLPEDESWNWARLTLYLLGKFGSSASFYCLFLYSSELFPTVIRASTMSWMLTSGKFAAILAPQTPLLSVFYKPLPVILFSCVALVSAGLTLTFPETKNVPLPDTMEEAEDLGLNNKKRIVLQN